MKKKEGKILKIIRANLWIVGLITVIFCIFNSAFIITSLIYGSDIVTFPANLLAHYEVLNNPKFQDLFNDKDMRLDTLCWFTAQRTGDIWIFYIEVQDKEINDGNRAKSIANKWHYYTNGDVYYNSKTGQITIDLIGYRSIIIN